MFRSARINGEGAAFLWAVEDVNMLAALLNADATGDAGGDAPGGVNFKVGTGFGGEWCRFGNGGFGEGLWLLAEFLEVRQRFKTEMIVCGDGDVTREGVDGVPAALKAWFEASEHVDLTAHVAAAQPGGEDPAAFVVLRHPAMRGAVVADIGLSAVLEVEALVFEVTDGVMVVADEVLAAKHDAAAIDDVHAWAFGGHVATGIPKGAVSSDLPSFEVAGLVEEITGVFALLKCFAFALGPVIGSDEVIPSVMLKDIAVPDSGFLAGLTWDGAGGNLPVSLIHIQCGVLIEAGFVLSAFVVGTDLGDAFIDHLGTAIHAMVLGQGLEFPAHMVAGLPVLVKPHRFSFDQGQKAPPPVGLATGK